MRAKRMLLFSCALSIAGPVAGQAEAYPISPLTLWELVGQSDLIVVARTEEVTRPQAVAPAEGEEATDWRPHVARLGVVEVWKGAAPAEIRVEFDGDLICPAPAHYEEGATVLAFLRRPYREERTGGAAPEWPEDAGTWQAVGLSYGTLYPEPGEIPVFRDRVREAVELLATRPAPELPKRDWLLRTAARRATRWHGLYELAASGDEIHSFYDSSVRRARAVPPRLPELEIVLEGFLAEPSADVTRERLGLGEHDFDVDHDALRLAWDRVFDELSRERQPPLRLPKREYRPVGSRTPS